MPTKGALNCKAYDVHTDQVNKNYFKIMDSGTQCQKT